MPHQLKTDTIYCGDNLQILKDIPDESIDLIYIDPPFNSNRNYEVFWGDIQEKRAFEDRFGDAQAYIHYMQPRIIELYRVLKPTGSFFYHCDWHASHYVKMMLDQIFDFNNFLNEIIWRYRTGGNSKRFFARKHDTIFLYAKKEGTHTFHPIKERSYVQKKYNYNDKYPELWDDDEKKWYHEVFMRDVWIDIEALGTENRNNRRLGYPTQKPPLLMDRIINVSSNRGDVILDPFCGCGTTLVAAEKLNRKWIGMDISPAACRIAFQRVQDLLLLKNNQPELSLQT
jgi:DNA modification methylase